MRGEERTWFRVPGGRKELPPHARRREHSTAPPVVDNGITSACAEKRLCQTQDQVGSRNYLRMRGEEAESVAYIVSARELPPHARRRGGTNRTRGCIKGITSACAEKRRSLENAVIIFGNYLRMRGEETHSSAERKESAELPPHARRRVAPVTSLTAPPGITSACAEKSAPWSHCLRLRGNYLRMRGEESMPKKWIIAKPELPPHARRREERVLDFSGTLGITSACAEKSLGIVQRPTSPWNYLRMRGEEWRCYLAGDASQELPPHARRRDFVTCENFNVQRRFVTLHPVRSRVTTCRPSLLYFFAVDQECSQRILALYWNRY